MTRTINGIEYEIVPLSTADAIGSSLGPLWIQRGPAIHDARSKAFAARRRRQIANDLAGRQVPSEPSGRRQPTWAPRACEDCGGEFQPTGPHCPRCRKCRR